ncbi:MAG: Phosphoglucosamine mutase [Syntrophus sp. SKADARSKE-3]|nr:Phosphoglucosamine mutase [Syntrophus sp. SKADARSKE-3]
MGKFFGTDGIRGMANQYPMTAEMALNIGRATAHVFKRRGHSPRIIIGKDTRLSGYMFESAMVSGICSMGVHAMMVGVLPTPGIAFLTASMRADAGIVISASHNPFHDNGFKIFSGEGFKLPDEKETAIEELILANNMHSLHPSPRELGKAFRLDDARGRYIVFLKHAFPKAYTLEGMKIVMDCANGATYRVAPETFAELGAEVFTICDEPNGENINVDCGSQYPERLAREVIARGADCGFAFDGDGDRVIAVDEKGMVLTGDRLLAVCAKYLQEEDSLNNNLVVRTVMSNIGLTITLRELGIDSIMTDVGDRYVLEAMQAKGAVIGGEDSGHLIFLNHQTSGDGIVTALQVLAAMKRADKPLSDLAGIMTVYPQVLINVDVKERKDISTVPAIVAVIRDVEERLGTRGRVLVRYSGTQPLCRIMVEGPTPEETDAYCREIAQVIKEVLN